MTCETFRLPIIAAGLAVALAAGAMTPGFGAPVLSNTAAVRVATPSDVIAVGGGGVAAGLIGGLAVGTIAGAALARPHYYYPPPYYYVDPYDYPPPPLVYEAAPVYADPPPYGGPETGQVRRCWDRAAGQWRAC
jgi:hypothetical protein